MKSAQDLKLVMSDAHQLRSESLREMARRLKGRVKSALAAIRDSQIQGIEAGRYVNQV